MRPVLPGPGAAAGADLRLWAGEEDRILFYDATGQRFAETHLSEAPDPQKLAA